MSLFRKFTETVSKSVSTATVKAQQTVEITRLHTQITSKRKEIDKLQGEIGAIIYEGYATNDLSLAEPRIIPICQRIEAIQKEIDAIENRMMELRNEKECACGKKVPIDVRFCPSCGTPFPEPLNVTAEGAEQTVPVLHLPEGDHPAASADRLESQGALETPETRGETPDPGGFPETQAARGTSATRETPET